MSVATESGRMGRSFARGLARLITAAKPSLNVTVTGRTGLQNNQICTQRERRQAKSTWAFALILLLMVFGAAQPVGAQSVDIRVVADNDDAEEDIGSGAMNLTSTDLELITESGDQELGMRFLNLTIPPGATITNAYVEFTTDEVETGTTDLTFWALAEDNPADFSTGDITSRPKSAASVPWSSVPAWNTVGEKHQTPDLSLIIQETVNRGGWSSGNALTVIVTGTSGSRRTAESYDGADGHGDLTLAPLLHVDYTPASGANLALSKSDSPDPVLVNQTLSYSLVVDNLGPDDATDVILVDTLPATVAFQSVITSQGSCVHSGEPLGGTVTCTLGTIISGANATVDIIVTAPPSAGSITNNASVSTSSSDSNAANDNASEDTTVQNLNVNQVCYLVADAGGGGGGNDLLTRIDTADFNPVTNETNIGIGTGTNAIEAIAWNSATMVLYGANANRLGILSTITGVFAPLPSPFGTGSGTFGSITFTDVDGLTYDATTGILYGSERQSGADVLIQIDMTTGAHVPNAFGAGIDYVPIIPIAGNTITDDIAVDPTTGVMYASTNSGGSTDRLIIINKFTGTTSSVGVITVPDIEGLGTDATGQLWGTSGTQGILYELNKATGEGTNGRPIDNGSDYESVDCFAFSPTVVADLAVTKTVDDPTPPEGDTITYTVTVTNTGPGMATVVQLSDALPAGVTFVSATASQGTYDSTTGAWFVGAVSAGSNATLNIQASVDTGTAGTTITNVASVTFLSQNDPNSANDTASVDIVPVGRADIQITKIVSTLEDPVNGMTNPIAIPGATMLYTVGLTNSGNGDADTDSVIITEPIPANTALRVIDFDGTNPGPVAYANGTPASGLTYTFVALGDPGDDIEFSDDGGSTYTYMPVADGNGVDTAVTHMQIKMKGAFLFSVSGDPNFEVLFKNIVQ
ncbi:hypothetical protein MnTg04_01089 [bacterium MnTg04]|nr:hypothetical protein MnTg04_01089 [bacterium MnTg04]